MTVPYHHHVLHSSGRRTSGRRPGPGRRRWAQRAAVVLLAVTVPWAVGGVRAASADSSLIGADVSHPQCGRPLPTGQAFAVVGVNGGTATTTNPCLAEQLAWAAGSTGATVHDDVQLYVNTANPGPAGTWPLSGENRYGACDGSNSLPCVDGGATRNFAVLEGMTEYFTSIGSRGVGLYSTQYQWDLIVGDGVAPTSSLNGLSNWRPTGNTLEGAQANCDLAPLTPGGVIEITQFTTDLDYNHSCI